MLDIEVLRIIWWVLLGILLMGFAVTDGFDFGVAVLMPVITRNEVERIVVLNTIRPFWEGNQVWIILGAGAIFAAWPFVYAVAFSGTYFLILLLLLTMGISRPVSFKYREKMPSHRWRRFWDAWVFIGGFVPAIIFGMLMGNSLIGLPFSFDDMLRMSYSGSFFDLFNSFAMFCGLTSLTMLVMHGGIYLTIKTEDLIRDRAIACARFASLSLILLFALGGVLIAYTQYGYQIVSGADPLGFSNPLHKEVSAQIGGWLQNYSLYPLTLLAPLVGFSGALFAFFTVGWRNGHVAFIFSSLSIMGVIATVGVSMFPFILPSSTNMKSSLLVWDASSSQLTLLIMLVAVIIFLPLIIIYTSWVYRALNGKVTIAEVEREIKESSH